MNAIWEQLLFGVAIWGVVLVVLAAWWHVDVRLPRRALARAEAPTLQVRKFIPKNKPVLVIAGTYREYEMFCAQEKLNRYHDAVYVRTHQDVVGKRRSKFAYVGTWYERLSVLQVNAIAAQLHVESCREYPQYNIYP